MKRTRAQWALSEPALIARQHMRTIIQHVLLDAKADIAELYKRQDELLAALKDASACLTGSPAERASAAIAKAEAQS